MKIITTKRWFLMAAFIAMAWKGLAQDTTSLTGIVTLKQCVDIAIKNNLAINESDFVAQNGKVGVQQAIGQMLPYISGNVSHSFSQGRVINSANNGYINQSLNYGNYSLSGTEYIWNGGYIRNNLAASKLTYQANKMDLQQQKDFITISVILGYLQVLSDKEQLNAAGRQVDATKLQLERLLIQDSSGAVSNPASLSDLKGSLAASELNVITLQNALESAKVALVQYLNLPYSAFDLQAIDDIQAPVVYDMSSDIIYQEALQNLAIIKSAHLKTLSAIKSFKAAKGALWPQLTFGGGAYSNYSSAATSSTGSKIPYGQQLGNNFNTNFGLGLYIPILQGLRAKSTVDLARITEKRTSFEEKSAQTTLQQNVKQAYVNMQTSFARYQKTVEELNAYKESYRVAMVRFDAGMYTSNLVDFVIAKNNVDQAEISLIAVKYDYILRTKILDYYQGKLTLQ